MNNKVTGRLVGVCTRSPSLPEAKDKVETENFSVKEGNFQKSTYFYPYPKYVSGIVSGTVKYSRVVYERMVTSGSGRSRGSQNILSIVGVKSLSCDSEVSLFY